MEKDRKCACVTCECRIKPGQGVTQQGKVYCSQACARECTDKTCVCVHDRCEENRGK